METLIFLSVFVSVYGILGNAESNALCESHDQNIVWTCAYNKDSTLNITIDCSLNRIDKHTAEVSLWQFPIEIKSLTIQNCDKLVVNSSCNDEKDFVNFHFLKIEKISTLILGGTSKAPSAMPMDPSGSGWPMTPDNDYFPVPVPVRHARGIIVEDLEITTDGMLPPFTSFENVQNATFTTPLVSFDSEKKCVKRSQPFKSLEIKNVTLNRFRMEFLGDSRNLTNFLMENSTITSFQPIVIKKPYEMSHKNLMKNGRATTLDSFLGFLIIDNADAVVKVMKSKIPDLSLGLFINCIRASEVIFSGNTFGSMKINPLHMLFVTKNPAVIKIKSKKFSLIGNEIPYWGHKSFRIESTNVNISHNTFGHIDSFNTDSLIGLPVNKTELNYSLIFSNNIIHGLSRKAFSNLPSDQIPVYGQKLADQDDEAYNFDFFQVFNNSIECSCKNFLWFDYMGRHEVEIFKSHGQLIKWFSDKNNNKCFNLPYCSLNRILYNFEELCDEDYTCLETEVPFNLKSSKSVFYDLLESVNRIENLSYKMLTVLSNESYAAEVVKDKKGKDSSKINYEAQKISQNEFSYEKQMYLCLLVITCIGFMMFAYQVYVIYRNCSFRNRYSGLGPKSRSQSERELPL